MMKKYTQIVSIFAAFLLPLLTPLNALPSCRDCSAEDTACQAQIVVDKLNCDAVANAEYTDALTTITNKINAGNAACDSEHGTGSLAALACRKLVGDIDFNMRAIAFTVNKAKLSLCRAAERSAKNACDKAYFDCQRDVASGRANCTCE